MYSKNGGNLGLVLTIKSENFSIKSYVVAIYTNCLAEAILMPASHCPEVDTSWKHDDRNFQIRL